MFPKKIMDVLLLLLRSLADDVRGEIFDKIAPSQHQHIHTHVM